MKLLGGPRRLPKPGAGDENLTVRRMAPRGWGAKRENSPDPTPGANPGPGVLQFTTSTQKTPASMR